MWNISFFPGHMSNYIWNNMTESKLYLWLKLMFNKHYCFIPLQINGHRNVCLLIICFFYCELVTFSSFYKLFVLKHYINSINSYFGRDFSNCCSHLYGGKLKQCFGHCILLPSSGVPCLSGHRNDSTREIIF